MIRILLLLLLLLIGRARAQVALLQHREARALQGSLGGLDPDPEARACLSGVGDRFVGPESLPSKGKSFMKGSVLKGTSLYREIPLPSRRRGRRPRHRGLDGAEHAGLRQEAQGAGEKRHIKINI